MRFHIIGFLAFIGWAALSTHIYVCNIKGLCDDQRAVKVYALGDSVTAAKTGKVNSSPALKISKPGDLSIYFDFDKSEFNADSSADRYFASSSAYLNNNSGASISITGYTDSIGTEAYNQALGYRRAHTLQHYFTVNGMNTERIKVSSKGESEPADDNTTAVGRANNRRTLITVNN
jgi:outer membrane protein OmpA-like peptidoglycan-associated protein